MNKVVTIYPPVGFSEPGQRDNNEDYILPPPRKGTEDARLFVVCDGVGGAERGEMASLIAAESITSYFRTRPEAAIDVQFIKKALCHVEEAFERAIIEEAELAGMSTTMTVLSLHPQGVTIAHVGDSRAYHIRDGKILHQTHDHSLVNEMVRMKQILPEEAAHHPRRNVITRAIQGRSRPTTSTVYITQDVAADDYFFLCTDGVLESIDNQDLCTLLTTSALSDSEKVDRLLELCIDCSKDNYSGYLVRVAGVAPVERSTPTADLDDESIAPFHLLVDGANARPDHQSDRSWLQRLFP